jgi:ABC-type polysaccharide/polyol phosphate export permease
MTNTRNIITNTSRSRLAFTDIFDGIRMWPVWSALGWQDIRQRYQRSVLGPFWITLTMMVTIAGMGPLYAALLRFDVRDFIPFLALGLIAWGLISSMILDGCIAFTSADNMIRSVRLPMTMHALRMIFRNVIIFFHNILAFAPFAIYLGIRPQWLWLMALPGVVLIVLAAFPVSLILGIFCARFRDMQQIVTSVVQLAFFLTPIIWKPQLLGTRIAFANYNPLYLFLEVVRGPVYGQMPATKVYIGTGVVIVVLYAVAIPVFIRFRRRIAFWI